MSRVFTYQRVSTDGQTTENQLLEIQAAGFTIEPHRVIAETISGSTPAALRPGWSQLLNKLEAGDVLVVTKLDRLGRNAIDVRNSVEKLAAMGVRVHCLALGGMDLTSSSGKLFMQMLAAFAEFELDLLKERTRAGMTRAKSQGKQIGRREVLTAEQRAECIKRVLAGEDKASVARDLGVSRTSVGRAVKLRATA